jgi:Mlc titration factor MtfA (ptsG expression regulator)
MFSYIKKWQRKRILRQSRITSAQWRAAFARLPLLDRLSARERGDLRDLAILFLHEKSFSSARGLALTQHMVAVIALQACLPVLYLGLDWYAGWSSIVVYPADFAPERAVMDEFGVVHNTQQALSGEAWQQGPIILSWRDVEYAGEVDGSNVVIHEFVHKLDMLNGAPNGFPPLHPEMDAAKWARDFSSAFSDFQGKVHAGLPTGLNAYGATAPAEFFAVVSEAFFEVPEFVMSGYPAVYENLKQFYRQDPLVRG